MNLQQVKEKIQIYGKITFTDGMNDWIIIILIQNIWFSFPTVVLGYRLGF
jgi:hypothetical protein